MESRETELEFGDWSIVIIFGYGDIDECRQRTAAAGGHMNWQHVQWVRWIGNKAWDRGDPCGTTVLYKVTGDLKQSLRTKYPDLVTLGIMGLSRPMKFSLDRHLTTTNLYRNWYNRHCSCRKNNWKRKPQTAAKQARNLNKFTATVHTFKSRQTLQMQ